MGNEYKCACGQRVISEQQPIPLRWQDGHTCCFVKVNSARDSALAKLELIKKQVLALQTPAKNEAELGLTDPEYRELVKDYNEFEADPIVEDDRIIGYTKQGLSLKDFRLKEIDSIYTSQEDMRYIQALTEAVVKLSYALKKSRYSIVDAIRVNIEANY